MFSCWWSLSGQHSVERVKHPTSALFHRDKYFLFEIFWFDVPSDTDIVTQLFCFIEKKKNKKTANFCNFCCDLTYFVVSLLGHHRNGIQ